MERLRQHAQELLKTEQPFVLGGDYNIIPAAEDVYDPQAWQTDALFRPESRAQFRALHPDVPHAYTFWDYQAGRWPRDQGIRIDHFLLSPQAADRLVECRIDKGPRAEEKASDHTPVVLELTD